MMKDIYYSIKRFLIDIPWKLKQIKFFFQRGFRGYADCDVWDLDLYLVSILVPALKQLKDNTYGYPAAEGINSPEDWGKALGKMILGFGAARRLVERTNWVMNKGSEMFSIPYKDNPNSKEIQFTNPWTDKQIEEFKKLDAEDEKLFGEGMELFHRYFLNLWD